MNGEIIQTITLALHAQAAIEGNNLNTKFLQNSAFMYCKSVEFYGDKKAGIFRKKVERRTIFSNPLDWINSLNKSNAKRVMVSSLKPPQKRNLDPQKSVAFVGGGNYWTIDIFDANQYRHSFHPTWQIGDRSDPDRKPWHVTYEQIKINPFYDNENLRIATEKFRNALDEIGKFSKRDTRLSNWTKIFDKACRQLDGEDHQIFHPDFVPSYFLSKEATNLIKACQVGWVFGGMGSWNDIWVDDAEEYQRVSNNYFNAIDLSLTAATNSRYL